MTKNEIIRELWAIIDDIDTYSDLAKDDNQMFRNLVERKVGERFEDRIPVETDGYNLTVTSDPDPFADDIKKLMEVQKGELHGGDYMVGLYNGMELALATFEKREAIYEDTDAWADKE